MNQTFHSLPLREVKVTVGNELVRGKKQTEGEGQAEGDELADPRRCGFWSHSFNYE